MRERIDQKRKLGEENQTVPRLWPDANREALEEAHADELGDAELKAARRLRTFPLAVAAMARKRWRRSFTQERDHRKR